jgi:superfamily II DNA or RNA helicase
LQGKLCAAGWDLVVFDEAHKLAAHFFGSKAETTARFRFAEKLGKDTRHLLLMTATPHNGKEEDFQLFLSLLDSDRFYGKFRDGVHKVDASDLMRRMVKEELVKFNGTPLFPERKAYTVNYELSKAESDLYEEVTKYVQTEMGKADQLDGQRRGSVGFALTTLQRRLASSPEAIYQSLRRRRERLSARLRVGVDQHQLHPGTIASPQASTASQTASQYSAASLSAICFLRAAFSRSCSVGSMPAGYASQIVGARDYRSGRESGAHGNGKRGV